MCDLILSCVALPLEVLNILIGSSHGGLFDENSVACWFYVATTAVSFVAAWLLIAMAITRVAAVLYLHKYERWLGNKIVQWLLYCSAVGARFRFRFCTFCSYPVV